MLSSVISDLRQGFRAVLTRPTFAAVVMLTLSLGTGANVAVYSLAEQILLRPLPVPEPERLVNLTDPGAELRSAGQMDRTFPPATVDSDSGGASTLFSYPMFRDLEREQEPFTGLAAHRFFEATVSTGERARLATGALVSGSYFSVLGLRPALGRLLGPEDDSVEGLRTRSS